MAEETQSIHDPVLPRQVLDGLGLVPGGIYVDGTLGEGGHSQLILEREPACRVIAFDQDEEILGIARRRLAPYQERCTLICANFESMSEHLLARGVPAVNGILLDLGISSFHYEASGRGFSFQKREPLDMRLGTTARARASSVVNEYAEKELVRIFREYGEERYAGRIARAIVAARAREPILTADRLADLVGSVVPASYAHERIHPATRVFQALRIEVNRELEVLQTVLGQTIDLLLPGGRLCVISFHSLEDRIVKQFMRANEPHCICPPRAPRCSCGRPGRLRAVYRKALVADDEEVAKNPRSRSARLRIAERIPDEAAV